MSKRDIEHDEISRYAALSKWPEETLAGGMLTQANRICDQLLVGSSKSKWITFMDERLTFGKVSIRSSTKSRNRKIPMTAAESLSPHNIVQSSTTHMRLFGCILTKY
ncbi:hypothetical protein HUJ04_004407 [Dendroctonus ponderosae]|nr:hypothetical protein HUJ04_004407 [Dendroctonus ponderosae]